MRRSWSDAMTLVVVGGCALLLGACTWTTDPSAISSSTDAPPGTAKAPDATRSVQQTPKDGRDHVRLLVDPNGLDIAAFGDAEATVIAAITRRLGEPDSDTARLSNGETWQICGARRTRVVRWGEFSAVFSDGPTEHGSAGYRHFLTWSLWGRSRMTPVATAAGVGIGSTIPDLRKAYGSRLLLHSAEARGTDELSEPSLLADRAFTTTAFDVGDRANPTLSGEFFEGRLVGLNAGHICFH